MTSKSEILYKHAFLQLKLIAKSYDFDLNFETSMMDFEGALRRGFKFSFP